MKAFVITAVYFIVVLVRAQDVSRTISIDITVANSTGFVTDLPQDAFTISEDGKPQAAKIVARDARPVSIGLIVDDSGTMREFGSGLVRMVESFLKNVDSTDEISLIWFNSELT